LEIRSVDFRGAALKAADRPREWFPHIAIAGRSNVGKSSLLNWLFRRQVARVAKAPGKTRTLNFYLVNKSVFLVDLPGYGYAKVDRQLKQQWGRELGRYLADERRLAGVVCLVDVRQGPTTLDLELQELLQHIEGRRIVVLTKADKVSRGQRAAMQQRVRKQLDLADLPPAVSVRTGEGRRELLEHIGDTLSAWTESQRGE